MKVINLEEDYDRVVGVEFDNGLKLSSTFVSDCCEFNYLDLEQFNKGREFEDMNAPQFFDAITIKKDGFSIKDSDGIPVWAQARSLQNGYYGNLVDLVIEDGEKRVSTATNRPYSGKFEGVEDDWF